MANEVNQLTINAAGTGWVDSIPSAVSTGYQAQNTNIQAHSVGQDLSSVRVSGTSVIVDISGPIDVDGIPFSVTSPVTLTPSSGGVQYIQIVPGATATQKSLELTTSTPVWDSAKNGLYNSGNRVLNWVIHNTSPGLRIFPMPNSQHGNNFGSLNQTGGLLGFTRWIDIAPLTYPYYYENIDFSTYAPSKACMINSDLYLLSGGSVYHFDGVSDTLIGTVSVAGTGTRGLAYDVAEGNLIIADLATIYIMDGISGSVSSSFSVTANCTGITMVNGNLVVLETNLGSGNYIRIHDGVTSSILSSITLQTTYSARGLEYDGNNLIYGGLNSGGTASYIYVTKGLTEALHMTIDAAVLGAGLADFAFDGKHLLELDGGNDNLYIHGFA